MNKLHSFLIIFCLVLAPLARGQDSRPTATPTPTGTPTAGDPSLPPPTTGVTEADKKVNLWKAFFEDLDPSIAYFILLPVAVEAMWKLMKLPSSLPDAWQAVKDLWNTRENRAEARRLKEALKALKEARPELNAELEKTALAYVEHLDKLEPMLEKLKEFAGIKGNAALIQELETAIKLWKEKGEYHYIHKFLAKNKHLFSTHEGQRWRHDHRTWLENERNLMHEAVIAANHVTDYLNEPRGEKDRYPVYSTSDENSRHHPGRVYFDQDKRILGKDLVAKVEARCAETYAALLGLRSAAAWKGGTAWGTAYLTTKAATPLVRMGFTGGLAFLAWRAYAKTQEKYGKTPTQVKIDGARQVQVQQQVKLNAEASLEAQIDNRRGEIVSFTDALNAAIQDNQEEILKKLKDHAAATNTKLDMSKKRELFQSKPQLTRELLVALPATMQTRIGRDFTVDHLLKLLSLSPKDERVAARHKQLVTATLWRTVDNLFPELDDFDDENTQPKRASSFLGKELRTKIVEDALKKMDPSKIKPPAVVSPHGALPDMPPTQAPPVSPTPAK